MKAVPFYLLILLVIISCDSKPKVIIADEKTSTPVEMPSNSPGTMPNIDVHQVVAEEILQAEKYTYVYVSENKEKFWIAISKQDITKGHTYYYRGGLKKTNFESKDFNRTFDVLYLVSSIIDANEHPGGQIAGQEPTMSETPNEKPVKGKKIAGTIALSDLFNNKSKYNGKQILVRGECKKANFQIMGKNWYHIQDGTKTKDKNIDFTITSTDVIQIGDEVTFKGTIFLNKDFGAGYRYDIIMENAVVKR